MNVVPEDFVNRAELAHDLDKIADSSGYAAPEMQSFWWGRAMEMLHMYLGEPTDGWKLVVAEIVAAKRDYNEYLEEKCPNTASS